MENDLNSIYTDLIMEHSMASPNKKVMPGADKVEKGHNPSCGDEIDLFVKFSKDDNEKTLQDLSFTGHGCAISQASTSIMIETLRGKSQKEAKEIVETFIKMIKGEIKEDEKLEVLEDAIAFKDISYMPARVKCALLAWHTMENILGK